MHDRAAPTRRPLTHFPLLPPSVPLPRPLPPCVGRSTFILTCDLDTGREEEEASTSPTPSVLTYLPTYLPTYLLYLPRPLPPCVERSTFILTCDLAARWTWTWRAGPLPLTTPTTAPCYLPRPLPPCVERSTLILTCDLGPLESDLYLPGRASPPLPTVCVWNEARPSSPVPWARQKQGGEKTRTKKETKLQHLDFARGHPPHYYPGQNVLNFADRTGCGALTIVWP